MTQLAKSQHTSHMLLLEKGKQSSRDALRLVQQIDPDVVVVYLEERDPETPTPCLLEDRGPAYYGLDSIQA